MYLYKKENRSKKIERVKVTKETNCYYFDGEIKISKKTMQSGKFPYTISRYFIETPELLEEYEKQIADMKERVEKAISFFRENENLQEYILKEIERFYGTANKRIGS